MTGDDSMSKIIKTGDVHLGLSGRLSDQMWALRVIREYARRHDISLILGLGDLFHDRSTLGIDVLCQACDYFIESHQKYGQRWINI